MNCHCYVTVIVSIDPFSRFGCYSNKCLLGCCHLTIPERDRRMDGQSCRGRIAGDHRHRRVRSRRQLRSVSRGADGSSHCTGALRPPPFLWPMCWRGAQQGQLCCSICRSPIQMLLRLFYVSPELCVWCAATFNLDMCLLDDMRWLLDLIYHLCIIVQKKIRLYAILTVLH